MPVRLGTMINRTLRRARRLDPMLRHPLTVLTAATAVGVLCGLVLHPRVLALAGCLAALIAVGLIAPWLSLRGLRGTVTFDADRGREGEPVAARITLRNRAPWAARGLAVRFGLAGDPATEPVAIRRVGGWQSGSLAWEYGPERRGRHPAGGAWIVTGFPFGLRRARRALDVERPLLVWPLTFPVGRVPEEAGGEGVSGQALRDRAGDAGDLLGIRPYRRGDPLRRVHWAQTARTGDLIVCELQATAAARVQIVLDLDPQAHAGSGPDGSLEWAIRVAASLADAWLAQGADVELIADGRALGSKGGSVPIRRRSLLDALAVLDGREADPLGAVLQGPTCRRPGCGFRVVVCTDRARIDPGDLQAAGRAARMVVLATAAFESRGGAGGPVHDGGSIRPWIVLDDRDRIPDQLLQGTKGDGHGR